VLFDFATTVFSFVVVTRYLNDWILEERNQPDIVIGAMTAVVSVALVVSLPALGARADRTGRRMAILVPFSLLSIAATAVLGVVGPVWAALVAAAVATYGFYAADAQYHPLLADVATPARQGRVSGIGVAVGLVGSLVALATLGTFVDDGEAQQAFLPAAGIYLLFALPLFLFLREGPPRRGEGDRSGPDPGVATERSRADGGLECDRSGPDPSALRRLFEALRRARGEPYGRFLFARFFYIDALATAIQFTAVYARRTGDFDGDRIDLLLGIATVAAILASIVAGFAAERVGARRVIALTLSTTIGALVVTAVTGSGWILWAVGPCIGGALGSLSAVDRILMLHLAPGERRGEEFGLYALVGKLSAGFGPLVLWGGTVLVATAAGLSRFDASRCAVIALSASAGLGLWLLRDVPDDGPVASSPS
jgi:UMF1 family MFS transporter